MPMNRKEWGVQDAEALGHEQMTGCAGGEKQKQDCSKDWPWKGLLNGTESGECPCGQSWAGWLPEARRGGVDSENGAHS